MARKSILSAVAAFGLAVAMTGTAAAQVLEIGDDGAVVTHSGPAIYSSEGVRSIVPEVPAAPMRATPQEVRLAIAEASARHTVPVNLVEAVAWQESRFNQAAVSPKGALGVMQLLPSTASSLGVNPTDLRGNVDGGVAYLAQQMRRFGDLSLALAAYNAGPGAVERYRGIPPYAETRNYVRAIMSRLGSAAE
jgi:soluble lytic murein transglycosylase-like protein